MHLPLQWNRAGSDPLCDAPLRVGGVEFRAAGLQVKDWGDWTLSFRLRQSASRYFDVTVGEGMPIVWVEPHGVELLIDAGRDARCTAPQDGVLVVSAAGRFYAVIAASGTKFTETNGKIAVRMPAGKAFAAFAAMKCPGDLALFARCAGSIPRDSRMDWSYDARRGKVTTTWTVKTEPLVPGGKNVVLQGWLAHHWRDAVSDVEFAGPEYLTPRGTMRTSLGNAFQWVYDFDGFLPSLPAPASRGGAHDFDPRRMEQLLDYCAKNPQYGDDSYWGGKDLLRFAQYMLMARELKSPTYARLRELSRKSLTDWLTFTPGEKAHYFTRYANWHALIGIKDSYDSARFNDQHFHYGYLTLSAALLGMEDPAFLADYGGMLRLVAKQYANWDRGPPLPPAADLRRLGRPFLGWRAGVARRQQPGVELRGHAVVDRPVFAGHDARRRGDDRDGGHGLRHRVPRHDGILVQRARRHPARRLRTPARGRPLVGRAGLRHVFQR